MKTSLGKAELLKGRFNHSLGAGSAAYVIRDRIRGLPKGKWVEPFLGRGDVFRAVRPQGQVILGDLEACAILDAANVSCGQDWKGSLKHDGPDTTFFLDPPWEGVEAAQSTPYAAKKPVPPGELVARTRGLQGAVAIYYRDKPEVRKVLCHSPFRCHTIPRRIFNHEFMTLLAVKPPGAAA